MDIQFERRLDNILKNPPAFVSIKYTSIEHRSINLTGLKNCSKMPSGLDNDFLSKERHILKRSLYQMNNAFKRHKFFQYAKRLSKLLAKIDDMQKSRFLDDLATGLVLDRDDSCRFVSAERFDFVVACLFAFIRVFESIPSICENCYRCLGNFLDAGHMTVQCCLFVGLAASIRSECAKMADRLIGVYHTIIVYNEKLKCSSPSNDAYVCIAWPRMIERKRVAVAGKFLVKSEKTVEYMTFFEDFLKNYNKKPDDFTTGLNRALLNNLQLQSYSNTNEDADGGGVKFTTESKEFVDVGIVVKRSDHFSIIKEEATEISSVKALKLFFNHSVKALKFVAGVEKSKVKKSARLVRRKFPEIVALKKSNVAKRELKQFIRDVKLEVVRILFDKKMRL